MKTKRNNVVDILRFVAVTFVSLFHFNAINFYQDNWYRLLVGYGYNGVPIFFVVSGYCIALSITHDGDSKQFTIKRFFRIFPTYWLSFIFVFIAVAFSLATIGVNSITILPKSIIDISATITLLTSPFTKIPVINWVYWSLTVEIFFYAVIAIYLSIGKRLRSTWLLLISILPFFLKDQQHGLFFFIKYWPSFLLGFSVYYLLIKQNLENMLLVLLALITLIFFSNSANDFIWTCIITSLIIIYGHFKQIPDSSISVFGYYSYAIYLIHIPLGLNIIGYAKQYPILRNHLWVYILYDLATFILITLIAKIIYNKFELPIISFGKRKFSKIKTPLNSNG